MIAQEEEDYQENDIITSRESRLSRDRLQLIQTFSFESIQRDSNQQENSLERTENAGEASHNHRLDEPTRSEIPFAKAAQLGRQSLVDHASQYEQVLL